MWDPDKYAVIRVVLSSQNRVLAADPDAEDCRVAFPTDLRNIAGYYLSLFICPQSLIVPNTHVAIYLSFDGITNPGGTIMGSGAGAGTYQGALAVVPTIEGFIMSDGAVNRNIIRWQPNGSEEIVWFPEDKPAERLNSARVTLRTAGTGAGNALILYDVAPTPVPAENSAYNWLMEVTFLKKKKM